MNLPMRSCPYCGANTLREYCAADGSQTIVVAPPDKDLREYRTDDVIGGRYRIIEPLGKGAATVVFDTEHVGTGQRVAVKLLSVDPTTDEGRVSVQRLFREARICASLEHPNTVRVFDVGQDVGGAFYLAMQRLVGQTLANVLQKKLIADQALTQGETLMIGSQILDALSAAHERGLVHRDLKPANVMLSIDRRGQQSVKVLDFGVARIENSALTRAGQLPGAPRYMSPEQCRNKNIDGRSDLYSLGCLLYACVCTRPPFEARDAVSIMRKHILEAPPDPREVAPSRLSDRFAALILRALEKDPDKRFQSADEMRAVIEQLRVVPQKAGGRRRMDSGSADPVTQSKVLAKMAQQTNDPARAYEYAKSAMELDPKNLQARQVAREMLGRLRRGSGTMRKIPAVDGPSTDLPAIPPPPPKR